MRNILKSLCFSVSFSFALLVDAAEVNQDKFELQSESSLNVTPKDLLHHIGQQSDSALSQSDLRYVAYTGLMAGLAQVGFDAQAQYDTFQITSQPLNSHYQSFLGEAVLGFGFFYQDFYLGLESGFNMGSGKAIFKQEYADFYENIRINDQVTTELDYAFNLSVVVGFDLTTSLFLYARAGWERAHFSSQSTLSEIKHPEHTSGPSGTVSQFLDGYRFGLGAQYRVADRWSIRAEYNYSDYRTLYTTQNGTTQNGVVGIYPFSIDYSYQPQTTSFLIGIVYGGEIG